MYACPGSNPGFGTRRNQGVGDRWFFAGPFFFAFFQRTVYRLLDEGDLQATRIRGCVRVSSEELKRFEASLLLDGDMP